MSLKDLLTNLIFKMQLKYSVLQYTLTHTHQPITVRHVQTCGYTVLNHTQLLITQSKAF